MPVPLYTPNGWVDDDGSGTTGTTVSAARMNNIEGGVSEASRAVRSVRVVATADVNVAASNSVLDGVDLNAGDRLLLCGQTAAAANGIYVYQAQSAPLVRAADFDASSKIRSGQVIHVRDGSANAGRTFTVATDQPVVGATAISIIGDLSLQNASTTANQASTVANAAMKKAPDADSGWIGVANNVTNNYAYTHNLGLPAVDLWKATVQGWFSPSNPSQASGIYPLDFRSMKVNGSLAAGEGYANPAWIRLASNTFDYGIWASMHVFCFYDPVGAVWNTWTSGYYRFMIWANGPIPLVPR